MSSPKKDEHVAAKVAGTVVIVVFMIIGMTITGLVALTHRPITNVQTFATETIAASPHCELDETARGSNDGYAAHLDMRYVPCASLPRIPGNPCTVETHRTFQPAEAAKAYDYLTIYHYPQPCVTITPTPSP